MRTSSSLVLCAIALTSAGAGSALAASGQGLTVSALTESSTAWSPWQGRIAFDAPAPAWRSSLGGPEGGGFAVRQERNVSRLNVLGDYFFAPSLAPSGGAGGLRATSGLLIGTRSQLSISQASLPGGLFGASGRSLGGSSLPYSIDAGLEPAAQPYLGIGYTGLSPSSGWSFSADLGLVGNGSSNAASRLFGSGPRSFDDSARDSMRLVPLVQLGLQYAF